MYDSKQEFVLTRMLSNWTCLLLSACCQRKNHRPGKRIKPDFFSRWASSWGTPLCPLHADSSRPVRLKKCHFYEVFLTYWIPSCVLLCRLVRGKSCKKVVESCIGTKSAQYRLQIGTVNGYIVFKDAIVKLPHLQ